jgi:hypothetical protein
MAPKALNNRPDPPASDEANIAVWPQDILCGHVAELRLIGNTEKLPKHHS